MAARLLLRRAESVRDPGALVMANAPDTGAVLCTQSGFEDFTLEPGLHIMWDVVLPIAPATMAIIPGVWRNVCPLGTTSQLARHAGRSGGSPGSPATTTSGCAGRCASVARPRRINSRQSLSASVCRIASIPTARAPVTFSSMSSMNR